LLNWDKYVSKASAGLLEFGIRKIFEAAQKLEAQGSRIIHLELGRPDFDTPCHIKNAAISALEAGEVHYTSNWGLPALREAIASYVQRKTGVSYNPHTETLVTVGGSEAVFLAFAALLDPGDEVLVGVPAYPTYLNVPQFFGARVVSFECPEHLNFAPDPDDIRKKVSERTKLLVLNTPNNPTGSVYPADVLEELCRIACENDLIVLSDEIYCELVYEGTHVSPVVFPGMRQRTIILNGLSKTYSMTGWRVGYAVGPAALLTPMYKVHQYNTACAPSFCQIGAITALTSDQSCVDVMRNEFKRRRDLITSYLNQVKGFTAPTPQGAFYAFPRVSVPSMSDVDVAFYLLEKAGVALVPGSFFGAPGFLRLSYASSTENLKSAGERIIEAMAQL